MKRITRERGIGFIEILVSVLIIGVGLLGIGSLFTYSLRVQNDERMRIRAGAYLEEGIEAVKAIRGTGWENIPASGTRYLSLGAPPWSLFVTDPGLIDGVYTRSVTFTPAYRDGNGDLAASGLEDADIRKVRIEISWSSGGTTRTEFIETYIRKV
ncbi:MAG: hypothetical protein HY460_00720 [Parcubacteria group bacterium]|nr:hypothetical protein [Parcubacteria group bacterium]